MTIIKFRVVVNFEQEGGVPFGGASGEREMSYFLTWMFAF